LRQLEFAFEQFVTRIFAGEDRVVGQAPRLPNRGLATEAVALQCGRANDLQTKARELLRSLGANRIAAELRVEWNRRLKTAAGRADYRQKVISLHPRLMNYPERNGSSARQGPGSFGAEIRRKKPARISPSRRGVATGCRDLGIAGEKRCHTLPFPAKPCARRFIYRCPNCGRNFPRVR